MRGHYRRVRCHGVEILSMKWGSFAQNVSRKDGCFNRLTRVQLILGVRQRYLSYMTNRYPAKLKQNIVTSRN